MGLVALYALIALVHGPKKLKEQKADVVVKPKQSILDTESRSDQATAFIDKVPAVPQSWDALSSSADKLLARINTRSAGGLRDQVRAQEMNTRLLEAVELMVRGDHKPQVRIDKLLRLADRMSSDRDLRWSVDDVKQAATSWQVFVDTGFARSTFKITYHAMGDFVWEMKKLSNK